MIKIAITGPESTGKSWLSRSLSEVFNAPWVMEYARIYLESLNQPYTIKDVIAIARGQRLWERGKEVLQPSWLFCDTDMTVCRVWCEVKYGYCPDPVLDLYHQDDYHLYLLCAPDLPWEPDPLREHPSYRWELFEMYRTHLNQKGIPWHSIQGVGTQRLILAMEILANAFPGHVPEDAFARARDRDVSSSNPLYLP